ncbi:MAG: lipopeptide [Gammaproteobacteria bacterium]|nr:lipopeptide [Gammaproteobacteria bacterium]
MRWLLLTLITLQAATCGQKGPLTVPDDEQALVARPAAVPSLAERA